MWLLQARVSSPITHLDVNCWPPLGAFHSLLKPRAFHHLFLHWLTSAWLSCSELAKAFPQMFAGCVQPKGTVHLAQEAPRPRHCPHGTYNLVRDTKQRQPQGGNG